MESQKPVLKLHTLYLGDNGRCTCGDMQCAGATAYFTGRDLSGQRLVRIRPEVLATIPFMSCETCGMRPAVKS